jgi:hypothetical protein
VLGKALAAGSWQLELSTHTLWKLPGYEGLEAEAFLLHVVIPSSSCFNGILYPSLL